MEAPLSLRPHGHQAHFLGSMNTPHLRWYQHMFDDLLDDPMTQTPSARITFALINAELSRRNEEP